MIRNTIFAAAALAAVALAAPASAQTFSGPRVGAEVGIVGGDFAGNDERTYNVNAGYDVDLGTVVVGAEVGYTGVFNSKLNEERELYATARLGTKVTDNVLLYGTAGYTNARARLGKITATNDGYRVGAGVEVAVSGGLYTKVETRYADYGKGAHAYQTVLGVGYRF